MRLAGGYENTCIGTIHIYQMLILMRVFFFFFSIWVFFHGHSRFTGQQGKGEATSLTPLYHFDPLHRHLDISRAITAEFTSAHSQQLESDREPLVSERKPLTTKLCAHTSIHTCLEIYQV